MTHFLNRLVYQFFSKIFVCLFLFAGNASYSQVQFKTICTEKKISKNDLLQVQFKLENANNLESLTPPTFDNFSVVSGPNQEIGRFSYNGKIEQFIAISYYLKPSRVGQYIIKGAKAVVDGKEYKSNPITVEITNAPSSSPNGNQSGLASPFPNLNFDMAPENPKPQLEDYILKPGENIDEKIKKSIFLKLETDKKTCYVGEPITAKYKLYTRLNSESTITDVPSFNGFSVTNLEVNNDATIEKVNGRHYTVYVLRKAQLYPLQSGAITLGPMVSSNKISFLKSDHATGQRNDLFNRLFQDFGNDMNDPDALITKTVTLTTTPLTITVKPLPQSNVPTSFKGAVGRFSIQSSLEKNQFTTDDAMNLKVVINGQGNIQLVNAPTIHWPQNFEVFDAKQKDDIDETLVPMRGSKTFLFPFVVSKPGIYKIDSISFSYFDPSSNSYKTIQTNPIEITVDKSSNRSNNFIFPKQSTLSNTNKGFFQSFNFEIMMLFGFLALIVGVILFSKLKRSNRLLQLEKEKQLDELKNKWEAAKSEFAIPENPLLEAHDALMAKDSNLFFQVLHSSFKKYLSLKLQIPTNEVNKKTINEKLDSCNVSIGTSFRLNELLEEIELNLYAKPSEETSLNSIYEKAGEVVSLLNKQIC